MNNTLLASGKTAKRNAQYDSSFGILNSIKIVAKNEWSKHEIFCVS